LALSRAVVATLSLLIGMENYLGPGEARASFTELVGSATQAVFPWERDPERNQSTACERDESILPM
jgi:hypothetical protein